MLLGSIEQMLQRLVSVAFSRPKLILSLTLFIFLGLGVGALRLTQVVSMVDQLDPQMLSTMNTLKTRELFDAQASLGFILRVDDQFKGPQICRSKRFISKMERKYPQIESSFSGFDLRQLQTSGSVAYYPLVLEDPCAGLDVFSLDKIKSSPWAHLLTSPSMKDFTVSFNLNLQERTPYGTFNPALVGALLDDIQSEFGDDIPLVGTLAQEYYTMQGLSESTWLNALILFIIFICFKFFLGTFRASFLYGLTLVLAATMIYGAMGWVGHALDPLSVCLFLILAISSMEDFVFVSQKRMTTDSLPEIFRELALPCFLTSLTTILAFLTLGFSDLESIRHFGIWAAVGGLIEWGLTFLFLPALMTLFPSLSHWTRSDRKKGDGFILKTLSWRVPRLVSILSIIFFFTAYVSVNNFKMSQTPTEMFPKDHPFQQSLDFLLKDRGWVASIDFVMTRDVEKNKRDQLLELIAKDDIVFKTETWRSVVSYVANGQEGLTRAMVERELALTDLSHRYLNAAGDERVVVYLRTSNTEKLNILRKKIEHLCPHNECWVSGEFVGFADFSQSLISTLFESLFLSVMIVASVVVMLALVYQQRPLILGLLFSSLWGPAVLLSLIYFFGISINFVTCVVASCLVGLTGDNAIMFLCHKENDIHEGMKQRAVGSVQTALMMSLCSLTFIFSYFEPPQMLGILLSIGFIASLIGDVWLLKGFAENPSNK
jgi:predicted RND superfamily exporter protein